MAEAQYDAATPHRVKAAPLHLVRRAINAPAVTSLCCGVIGLAVQLPVMLLVLARHAIPGNVWSESVLLSVLPFLGIFFGATALDQIAKGQHGRRVAGIGLLIGVAQFVPVLLFLLSQD